MIVLGLDFEATGLDTNNDRVTEIGAVVWDTTAKAPLALMSEFVTDAQIQALLAKPESYKKIPAEWIAKGIEPVNGFALLNVMARSHGVTHIVAHNGNGYDRPLYAAEVARHGLQEDVLRLPWIDTRFDLPYPDEIDTRKLPYLAAEHGFLNPFPHRAVFDVMTMLRVMSKYDFAEAVRLSQEPWVTVRMVVSYDDRQSAKDLRYSWEKLGDKSYPKCWVKRIRACKLDDERKLSKFPIVVLEQG